MKYNEAIDIILDGGVTYRKSNPKAQHRFLDVTGLFVIFDNLDGNDWDWERVEFHKEDFIATDWIVEKDGVVYEEPPRICCLCKEKIECVARQHSIGRDGTPYDFMHSKCAIKLEHKQDETAELEVSNDERDHVIGLLSKRYGELEEFRRSIVNEDWLEKKMLCFMRKQGVHGVLIPESFKEILGTCCNLACQFCFPEEEESTLPTEEGGVPWLSAEEMAKAIKEEHEKFKAENYVEINNQIIPKSEFNERCHPELFKRSGTIDGRNDHIEQPREKVTVEELFLFIRGFAQDYRVAANTGAAMDGGLYEFIMGHSKSYSALKKKLEYLVSLQEHK